MYNNNVSIKHTQSTQMFKQQVTTTKVLYDSQIRGIPFTREGDTYTVTTA